MPDPTTPRYHINLPQPGDLMSDVADGFNNAWPIIAGAPKPDAVVAGSILPTTGYQLGQVIYLQGWKSSFVCIGLDANWGLIWRPIHAKFSPWITLTATQFLSDQTNYMLAAEGNPRYRVSNDGKMYLGGGIAHASAGVANTWPNGGGVGVTPVNAIPTCLMPDKILQWILPMHKTGMGNNNGNYMCKMFIQASGIPQFIVYNNGTGTADATSVFFNQVAWQIADRTDL